MDYFGGVPAEEVLRIKKTLSFPDEQSTQFFWIDFGMTMLVFVWLEPKTYR